MADPQSCSAACPGIRSRACPSTPTNNCSHVFRCCARRMECGKQLGEGSREVVWLPDRRLRKVSAVSVSPSSALAGLHRLTPKPILHLPRPPLLSCRASPRSRRSRRQAGRRCMAWPAHLPCSCCSRPVPPACAFVLTRAATSVEQQPRVWTSFCTASPHAGDPDQWRLHPPPP